MEMLLSFGVDSELLLIFCVGASLVTLGFMFGANWVSELALAFVVAHLIALFVNSDVVPTALTSALGVTPIPSEALLFIVYVVFGWWVAHTTSMSLDMEVDFMRIIPASLGTLGIIFLTVSHTISLGHLYEPGHFAKSIFEAPLITALFVLASLALVGLSRKV